MPSNLHVDDKLLNEAKRLGGLRTKRETVDAALREFIARRQRREVLDLFGTVEFRPDYDYKAERKRR